MNPSVFVIANKWWEVAPLLAVLQHSNQRQPEFSAVPRECFDASNQKLGGFSVVSPRLKMCCNGVNIEIWCVQDLMEPTENSSLTWEKARNLPRIIHNKSKPSLIIAFGTAACPEGSGRNGKVVIGSSVFVHDPYTTPPDPQKHWTHPQLNQVVISDTCHLIDKLPREFVKEAERRLLSPPNAPATPPRINVANNLVSVGVVNVKSNADYAWTDKQALEKFWDVAVSLTTESVETTHGVIRLVLDVPFLYVSGIVNTVGLFPEQVSPNPYSQNFVAAHNAAIALAWLLPELSAALLSQ